MHLYSFKRGSRVAVAVFFSVFFSTSCLVRRRTVIPHGQPLNKPVLTATKEDLLARLHRLSDPIQSFSLKVDMSTSVGGIFGGKVTDYPTIHGFILFLRPDSIRVIGLDPVVHSTIIDMVSIGNDFKVSLPTKNQFIEGSNDAPATSKNKLENLRPVAFLNSLLINPLASGELTILEDDTDETRAIYKLIFVRRDGDDLRLVRTVYFDRYTLDVSRQRTFDHLGNVVSETKYADWQTFGPARFPMLIDMVRPKDGYELALTVTEFKLNPPDVTPEKFVLLPPPYAQIRVLSK